MAHDLLHGTHHILDGVVLVHQVLGGDQEGEGLLAPGPREGEGDGGHALPGHRDALLCPRGEVAVHLELGADKGRRRDAREEGGSVQLPEIQGPRGGEGEGGDAGGRGRALLLPLQLHGHQQGGGIARLEAGWHGFWALRRRAQAGRRQGALAREGLGRG